MDAGSAEAVSRDGSDGMAKPLSGAGHSFAEVHVIQAISSCAAPEARRMRVLSGALRFWL